MIRDGKICAKKTRDPAKNTCDPIFLAQTFPAIQILLPCLPGSGEFPAGNLDIWEVFLCTRRRDSNITYSLTPNPLQPPASMDKLFDTPSGPISHREVRAAVAKEISLVMYDPVVDAFRSLR